MRNGQELILETKGQVLREGRLQSFVLKGEMVSLINVTFLKFDKWIRIVTTDEMTFANEVESDFETITAYGDDEFRYPLTKIEESFAEFEKYKEKRYTAVTELIHPMKGSFGLNFYFEDELNFIIHNLDYPEDRNEFIFENKVPKDLTEKTLYNNL